MKMCPPPPLMFKVTSGKRNAGIPSQGTCTPKLEAFVRATSLLTSGRMGPTEWPSVSLSVTLGVHQSLWKLLSSLIPKQEQEMADRGPCASCRTIGTDFSMELHANSNQRTCLLFSTVQMYMTLDSLRNNLCFSQTPYFLREHHYIPLKWPIGWWTSWENCMHICRLVVILEA